MEERMKTYTSSVRWFEKFMLSKLRKNRHKGHWNSCAITYLLHRLNIERRELDSIYKRWLDGQATAEQVINEAADVANFAMMIAENVSGR